jgi:four helix bundle protein
LLRWLTDRSNFPRISLGALNAPLCGMAVARRFTELDCWQLANDLKLKIYAVSERPALRRDRDYYEQIRDAAASGPRNIAEGFGRRTDADFARFLDVARASLTECQNHLQDGVDRGYLKQAECDDLLVLAKRSCGAVAGLQRHLRRSKPRFNEP